MRENRLLAAVRAGKPAIGPELWTGNPAVIEVMGKHPFQWVGIDVEHTPYASYETVEHIVRAADLAGLTPIASIESCDPIRIAKLCEVGVMGFIVPHILSADDAEKAFRAAKFPPLGDRGAASTVRQAEYYLGGEDWPEMADAVNQEIAIICKIEDAEALDNLDEILETPIDGLFAGLFDLSHSIATKLGDPGMRGKVAHPKVVEARNLIFEKCKEHNKFSGAVLTQLQAEGNRSASEVVSEFLPRGVQVYALTHEFSILSAWYAQMTEELRNT